MIDLHMHTVYSDGNHTVREILKMCEEKKIEYISITDHNTCKQYNDKALKESIFTGKVITGVEMSATFQNKKIEILAYNIKEPELIEEWSQKFFSEEILKEQQKESQKKLLDVCDKKGLICDKNKIKTDIPLTDYIALYIYEELMCHKENYKILGDFTDKNIFIRKGIMNPDSEYFVDSDKLPKPIYRDVINTIHKAGGFAFLAHPFEYRFDDTIGFISELRKEKELDGIECFHPSANKDRIKSLVNYAQNNNLYISGGSDYHGIKKPNIEIGMLNIPKEFIEKWV